MTADEEIMTGEPTDPLVESSFHAVIDFADVRDAYFTVSIYDADGDDVDAFAVDFPWDELDRALDERGFRRVGDWESHHGGPDIRIDLTPRDPNLGEVHGDDKIDEAS